MAIAFLRAIYGAAGMLRTFDNLSDLLSYRFEPPLIVRDKPILFGFFPLEVRWRSNNFQPTRWLSSIGFMQIAAMLKVIQSNMSINDPS